MKLKGIIVLMLITVYSQAQVSIIEKTVQWKSSAYVDRTTNDRVEVNNLFVIDTDKTIEWNQASEDAKQVFDIKSLDNKWLDLNDDGYVKYMFDCYNTSGSLTIQRQNGQLTVILEIPGLQNGSLSLLFEINQMTY